MRNNVVWKKETPRCVIQIVATPNWKHGKPINPKIPKWLVRIIDKWTHNNYFPWDREFELIKHMMDKDSLQLLREAFQIKEEHNKANLKNPESRRIELTFEEA